MKFAETRPKDIRGGRKPERGGVSVFKKEGGELICIKSSNGTFEEGRAYNSLQITKQTGLIKIIFEEEGGIESYVDAKLSERNWIDGAEISVGSNNKGHVFNINAVKNDTRINVTFTVPSRAQAEKTIIGTIPTKEIVEATLLLLTPIVTWSIIPEQQAEKMRINGLFVGPTGRGKSYSANVAEAIANCILQDYVCTLISQNVNESTEVNELIASPKIDEKGVIHLNAKGVLAVKIIRELFPNVFPILRIDEGLSSKRLFSAMHAILDGTSNGTSISHPYSIPDFRMSGGFVTIVTGNNLPAKLMEVYSAPKFGAVDLAIKARFHFLFTVEGGVDEAMLREGAAKLTADIFRSIYRSTGGMMEMQTNRANENRGGPLDRLMGIKIGRKYQKIAQEISEILKNKDTVSELISGPTNYLFEIVRANRSVEEIVDSRRDNRMHSRTMQLIKDILGSYVIGLAAIRREVLGEQEPINQNTLGYIFRALNKVIASLGSYDTDRPHQIMVEGLNNSLTEVTGINGTQEQKREAG